MEIFSQALILHYLLNSNINSDFACDDSGGIEH